MLFHLLLSGQGSIDLLSNEYNYFFTEINNELWVASAGNGFNRFDGLTTKHYALNDSASGLKGSFIQSDLYNDGKGKYWTATFENLCYFDSCKNKFVCKQLVVDSDTIKKGYRVFYFDQSKSLIYLRAGDQLLSYNTKSQRIHEILGSTKGNYFTAVKDTIIATAWQNDLGWELWVFKDRKWVKQYINLHECSNTIPHQIRNALYYLGTIWLLTDNGLVAYNPSQPCNSLWYRYGENEKNIINCGSIIDGKFLLGTDKHGLQVFDVKSRSNVRRSNLEMQQINSIYVDKYQYAYLSNNKKGIEKFPVSKLINSASLNLKKNWNEIKSDFGFTILVDNENGLIIENSNQFIELKTASNALPLPKIKSIVVIDSNRILILGILESYIYYWKEKKLKPLNLNGSRQLQHAKLEGDELYIIADNKLFVYDTKDFTPIKTPSKYEPFQNGYQFIGHIDNEIQSFSHLSSKVLIFKGDESKVVEIGSFVIATIYDSKNKSHYVAANNGLYFIDEGLNVKNITSFDVFLKWEKIYALQQDDDAVYFSTKNRLAKLTKKSHKIEIFNKVLFKDTPAFCLSNDQLLIATDHLIKLHKTEAFKTIGNHELVLDYFKVGDKIINQRVKNNFRHHENSLSWRYVIPDIQNAHLCKISYQLHPTSNATTIIDNGKEITFAALQAGTYRLTVKGLLSNGGVTKEQNLYFEISPAWYKSSWFNFLLFGVVVLGIYFIAQLRIKQIKRDFAIKTEMANLERSALQAQMNPHFIFNCLNSIQNFIMQNEKLEAMEYLNKFAHLIRQNLQASTGETLTLDAEIGMLKNYLDLEQMRSSNHFDYEIIIAQEIEPYEINIPPLLIQPFVENAVIHGVAGISENAKISLYFTKSNNTLIVIINDNGKGITEENKNEAHKSLGVSITQKRLEYINKNQDRGYHIHTQSSPKGTQITIQITL